MTTTLHPKLPLGFIVEGAGEYNAFPSMITKILGQNMLHIPRSNVRGIGGLINHLPQELSDFLLTNNIQFLYICIDLIDVVKAGLFSDCKELIGYLQSEIDHFINDVYPRDSRLNPLPEKIGVIVQIPKFESWMLSDFSSLAANNYIESSMPQVHDVDNAIRNPTSWIKINFLDKGFDSKNPRDAKQLLSKLDPSRMRENSRSYDKYFREVEGAYNKWTSDFGFS